MEPNKQPDCESLGKKWSKEQLAEFEIARLDHIQQSLAEMNENWLDRLNQWVVVDKSNTRTPILPKKWLERKFLKIPRKCSAISKMWSNEIGRAHV